MKSFRKRINLGRKKCEYTEQQIGGTRRAEACYTVKSVRTSNKEELIMETITKEDWMFHFKDRLEVNLVEFLREQ